MTCYVIIISWMSLVEHLFLIKIFTILVGALRTEGRTDRALPLFNRLRNLFFTILDGNLPPKYMHGRACGTSWTASWRHLRI